VKSDRKKLNKISQSAKFGVLKTIRKIQIAESINIENP
jgi:hypothetical protein